MKIIRFRREPDSKVEWGWLSEARVGVIHGSPFTHYRRGEAVIPLESVQLQVPTRPGKIICVGLNYAGHAREHGNEIPALPLIFLKPPSAVIGPEETIRLPPQSNRVEHEAELGVVIGLAGRWIQPEAASDHVLGYTAANDVTARDLQRRDGQWTRAKGFDSFCPLGPWIETDLDPADALITCSVNGQMRQMASTRDLIFPVSQLVAFISSVMTLQPGDVILTGTPAGVGPLAPGDEVTVEVEGLGALTNPVRGEKTDQARIEPTTP